VRLVFSAELRENPAPLVRWLPEKTMMRFLTLCYGVACYVIFFLTFLYLIGFLSNFLVPKGIDAGVVIDTANPFLANLGLIILFGVQHSVMARPWFKRRWTRLVPSVLERSTYVLLTSATLILIYVLWQPLTLTVWRVDAAWLQLMLWVIFAAGFLIVLLSTFMTDHFDLFGLRQVYLSFTGRVYQHPKFKVVVFYRLVRHPLYTGMFIALWATPHMTLGHLLFAGGLTVYVVLAVGWEEEDLVEILGDSYRAYQQEVPLFIPKPGKVHTAVRSDEPSPTRMR
jgi:protein-S-isoprenylcysteine O-methyltransferase Ste14